MLSKLDLITKRVELLKIISIWAYKINTFYPPPPVVPSLIMISKAILFALSNACMGVHLSRSKRRTIQRCIAASVD